MEGTIALIKQKYMILNDRHHLLMTNICKTILPNDKVQYTINENNMIEIQSLLDRAPQIHLGIVKEIASGNMHLIVPGLPKYVEIICPTIEDVKISSACIVEFTLYETKIIKQYDDIRNRANDKDLFTTLYEMSNREKITPIYKEETPYIDVESIKDLTQLNTITVDPVGSKDQDDAISVLDNKIYVHIVDAHSQIEPSSEEDVNSLNKSFTLYLSEKITNILPDKMAEDALSLKQGTHRKTITVEYEIDPVTYDILNTHIYRGMIEVKKRHNYETYMSELDPLLVGFCNHWKYNSLPLPNVVYDVDKETGELIETRCVYNNDIAHKIIETLMIMTNLTISKYTNSTIPQRFHDKIKKKIDVLKYTNNEAINALLSIKNYKTAVYDDLQKGHFGLGLDTYTHFTSPIRRYADVVVHRYLCGMGYGNLQEVLTHINKRENMVEKIVENYRRVKLMSYFEKNRERVWKGFVLYMTQIGACVVLEENLFECFVFINEKYQTGMRMSVKINAVDWINLNVKAVKVEE